jgi:hypothetical protein
MTNLLRDAVDGHAGLSRLKDMSIEAEQDDERLITRFNDQGARTLFQPTRIIMEKEGGRFVVSRRQHPRISGMTRLRATVKIFQYDL